MARSRKIFSHTPTRIEVETERNIDNHQISLLFGSVNCFKALRGALKQILLGVRDMRKIRVVDRRYGDEERKDEPTHSMRTNQTSQFLNHWMNF